MSEIQKRRKTIYHIVLLDQTMSVYDQEPQFFEITGDRGIPVIKSTSYTRRESGIDDGNYYFDLNFTINGVEYRVRGESRPDEIDGEKYNYYVTHEINRLSDNARMYPIYMSRRFDMSNYSKYTDELGKYRVLMNGIYALLQEHAPKI